MKKCLAALTVLFAVASAHAALTIQSCSINSSSINFGVYNPLDPNPDDNNAGQIQISCTENGIELQGREQRFMGLVRTNSGGPTFCGSRCIHRQRSGDAGLVSPNPIGRDPGESRNGTRASRAAARKPRAGSHSAVVSEPAIGRGC